MIPLGSWEWQRDSVRQVRTLGRTSFKDLESISSCSINVTSITIKMADTKSVFAGQLFAGRKEPASISVSRLVFVSLCSAGVSVSPSICQRLSLSLQCFHSAAANFICLLYIRVSRSDEQYFCWLPNVLPWWIFDETTSYNYLSS